MHYSNQLWQTVKSLLQKGVGRDVDPALDVISHSEDIVKNVSHIRPLLVRANFEEKLRHTLQTNRVIPVSQVQALDLHAIHERFSQHWDRIGEMVHKVVELIIFKHLSERDFYVRMEEYVYVIACPGKPWQEAEEICADISADIARNLIALLPGQEKQEIETITINLDKTMLEEEPALLESLGQRFRVKRETRKRESRDQKGTQDSIASGPGNFLKPEAFEEKLACGIAEKEAIRVGVMRILDLEVVQSHFDAYWDRVEAKVMTMIQMVIEKHLSEEDHFTRTDKNQFMLLFGQKSLHEAEVACQKIGNEVATYLSELDPANRRLGLDRRIVDLDRTVISAENRLLDQVQTILLEKIKTPIHHLRVPISLQDFPGDHENGLPKDLHFVYWPVWDVQRHLLAIYTCTPTGTGPDGSGRYGYNLFRKQAQANALIEFDLQTLNRTIEGLSALQHRGERLLIICSVHYYTLAQESSRREYIQLCESIPEAIKKYLIFEVAGLPNEISPIFVKEVVDRLKPYCRSVPMLLPLARSQFSNLRQTGVRMVGTNIEELLLPESKIVDHMETFVRGAEADGLEAYIYGLHSLSLVTAAMGAGFKYISGPAIYEDSPTITRAFRFEVEDLFSHLLSRQMGSTAVD